MPAFEFFFENILLRNFHFCTPSISYLYFKFYILQIGENTRFSLSLHSIFPNFEIENCLLFVHKFLEIRGVGISSSFLNRKLLPACIYKFI